jgi:phage/conjugal plasmid C-4 type zinc finger TraR family protein
VDEVEHGQEREQQDRERAIAAQMARIAALTAVRHRSAGEIYCIDCGDEIDSRRRHVQPGAERCTECQRRWEKHGV